MEINNDTYKNIIDNLSEGIYIVDRARNIIFWNKGAEQITGFPANEVIGKSCSDGILCHVDCDGADLCRGACPLSATIREGMPQRAEIFLHHKDGHRVPVSVQVSPLSDNEGRLIGGVETFADLSGRAANEQRVRDLEKLALLDRLTQLANRHYLEREIEARLEELDRYDIPFGILFLDIDNFKKVNDDFGHDTGDRVLSFLAGTLSANSRPFDLFGRWGGEEFVGILRNVAGDDLQLLGRRLLKLVGSSFLQLGNETLRVTVSIGGTAAQHTDSIHSLIQRADELMYQSKKGGKNRFTFG